MIKLLLFFSIAIHIFFICSFSEAIQNFLMSLQNKLTLCEYDFLILLFITNIGLMYIIHQIDKAGKSNEIGIGGIYKKIQNQAGVKVPLHRIDSNFIPGYLTKQSIFAAICIALISYILGIDNNKENGNAKNIYDISILNHIPYLQIIVFLLFLALIFSLISIICYDYSYRFKWNQGITIYLLAKGLWFDSLSFYLLIFALLLTISISYLILSVIISMCLTLFLWIYYFFDSQKMFFAERNKSIEIKSKKKSQIDITIDLISKEYLDKLLKEFQQRCTRVFGDKQDTLDKANNFKNSIDTNSIICLECQSKNDFLFSDQNDIKIFEDTLYFTFYENSNDSKNYETFSILLPLQTSYAIAAYGLFGYKPDDSINKKKLCIIIIIENGFKKNNFQGSIHFNNNKPDNFSGSVETIKRDIQFFQGDIVFVDDNYFS